jgi:putative ABC transport system permease protein
MRGLDRIFQNKLQLKLVRDLMASKVLFLSVIAVIFLGVSFFGGAFMGYQNLKASYDYTYESLQFADFTIEVAGAPAETVAELESVSGIEAVTGRVNSDVSLTLPGDETGRVLARAISLPSNSGPAVNDIKVEQGTYFPDDGGNVLLVEKDFAEHHGLVPGDTLLLTADDRQISFDVAGIVTSPEYIWPAKSRQEILVSPETFGVVFIPQETATELTGGSSVNEFCFLIAEGADREMMIKEAENILAPYVILDVVPQEEQPSNAAVLLQLKQMGDFSAVFPFLFLIVGALATYILLTRIIHNQRSQIGLMRAQGYTCRAILVHYLSFALVIGIAGATAGTIASYFLSGFVTGFYVDMLGIPYTKREISWVAVGEGLFIGIIPCILAGVFPALSASRLCPSEAMRNMVCTLGRKSPLERIFPILARLSFIRSLCTIIGVAFGIGLILFSASFIDSIDEFMSLQYDGIQRYDARINFAQPQSGTLSSEVEGWEGVKSVEPVLQVPVRLEHQGNSYSTALIGLSPESELYGLNSINGSQVSVSDEGILLGEAMRDELNVHVGDVITIVSYTTSQQVQVDGFTKQTMGSYGFIALNRVQMLFEGEPAINGLMLNIEPQYIDSLREKVYQMQGTAALELTSECG